MSILNKLIKNNPLQNNPAWTRLAEREKRLVIGLVVFLVIMALYSLVWSPIQNKLEQQTLALQKAESEWLWQLEQAPKAVKLATSSKQSTLNIHSKTALMDALQHSLRQQRLLQEAEGLTLTNKGVTVYFEEVDAPRLFRWIAALEQKGLGAISMKLLPINEGITQAEITYEVAQ